MMGFTIFVLYVLFGVISQALVNRHREHMGKRVLHYDRYEIAEPIYWFFNLWVWPFIAVHHWTTRAVDKFFKEDNK